jgi:pyruvate formate lyase activating enzyme
MNIGGIVPFTTIDFPGALAAVLFCQGCPWRCSYCHNPQLQPCQVKPAYPWPDVLSFLQVRKGFIDAVVFSGGEPTQQRDLPDAINAVRSMGFKIGLHTSGVYPDKLMPILPLVDWVGMDVKAPFEEYEKITGAPHSGNNARDSAHAIIQSGILYEFRTTVHPLLLTASDIKRLADQLVMLGAKHYVLQAFRSKGCENEMLCNSAPCLPYPWDDNLIERLKEQFPLFTRCANLR